MQPTQLQIKLQTMFIGDISEYIRHLKLAALQSTPLAQMFLCSPELVDLSVHNFCISKVVFYRVELVAPRPTLLLYPGLGPARCFHGNLQAELHTNKFISSFMVILWRWQTWPLIDIISPYTRKRFVLLRNNFCIYWSCHVKWNIVNNESRKLMRN